MTNAAYFAFVARDTARDAVHFALVHAIPLAAYWWFIA